MKKLKLITLLTTASLFFSSHIFAGQVSLMKPPIDGGVETSSTTIEDETTTSSPATESSESWFEALMKEVFGS